MSCAPFAAASAIRAHAFRPRRQGRGTREPPARRPHGSGGARCSCRRAWSEPHCGAGPCVSVLLTQRRNVLFRRNGPPYRLLMARLLTTDAVAAGERLAFWNEAVSDT